MTKFFSRTAPVIARAVEGGLDEEELKVVWNLINARVD
jgi:hypothetical protein